jgi:hypothetical protein
LQVIRFQSKTDWELVDSVIVCHCN